MTISCACTSFCKHSMARYVQRITLLGRERWIGWEVDGIGTEIPGLTLADDLSDDELRARGVKEFHQLTFESFLEMGGVGGSAQSAAELLDDDIDFRLDALQVGMDRFRSQGHVDVTRDFLATVFGDAKHIDHPRVQQRFRDWEAAGGVKVVGEEGCYLRITGRLT
jgi:hypothetical protein